MICETCGKNITNGTAKTCPHCNANVNAKDQSQELPIDVEVMPYDASAKKDKPSDYVITPEVVGAESYNSNDYRNNSRPGYAKFVYSSYRGQGANTSPFENGCFSTLITLVLALSCAIQFGILASIGFLVFSGIGSIVTFFLRVKSVMAQRAFNPWIARVISWGIAYMLIMWLAG